jgi:Tfp pilus assembly protein PilO
MTKTRQWSLMTVIVVIVVFAGGWFLLVKPQRSQISSVKAQATSQQQANQVLLQQIAARQGQQKQLPHEQAQLQKLATQIPTAVDEPGIIRDMSAAASGAGVNLLSLTPAPVVPIASTAVAAPTGATPAPAGATTLPSATAGQLVELPVSISVIGSYANLESYFQLLEKLPRAILVPQFSICPAIGGAGSAGCPTPNIPVGTNTPKGTLAATISADVFFSPTTPTAAAGAVATLPSTAPTTAATTPASPAATTTSTAPTAPASGN